MILLDLALQGIRDLSGSAQTSFKGGYNGITCGKTNPSTLVEGLKETLYAGPYDPQKQVLAAPGAEKTVGVATAMANDRAVFRVVRDLVRGGVQLSQYNAEAKQFVQASNEVGEINQLLRGRVGLLSKEAFESVFCLKRSSLPSNVGKAPEPVAPAIPSGQAAPNVEGLRTRLAEVERIVSQHAALEQMEFEFDGLQKEQFQIEDALKTFSTDDTALVQAQEAVNHYTYLDPLGDNFLARFQAYEEMRERRDTDLKRWRQQREELERKARTLVVEPVSQDWRVWAGLAAGFLAVVSAYIMGDGMRFVALLDIPAFFLTAFALWQALSTREDARANEYQLSMSDEREGKIRGRASDEIKTVEELMKLCRLDTAVEVQQELAAREQAHAALKYAEQQLSTSKNNPERIALEKRLAEVKQKAADIEDQLAAMSGSPVDMGSLRAEATDLRLRIESLGAQAPPVMPITMSGAHTLVAGDPMEALRVVQQFLDVAVDLMLTARTEALAALGAQASTLIDNLSAGLLSRVAIGTDGTVTIATSSGDNLSWAEADPVTQDLVYLALRGALLELLSAKMRMPLVIDDDAEGFGPLAGVVPVLSARVGQKVQVLHFAPSADRISKASHQVSL